MMCYTWRANPSYAGSPGCTDCAPGAAEGGGTTEILGLPWWVWAGGAALILFGRKKR